MSFGKQGESYTGLNAISIFAICTVSLVRGQSHATLPACCDLSSPGILCSLDSKIGTNESIESSWEVPAIHMENRQTTKFM
jgi:hypothetical protein